MKQLSELLMSTIVSTDIRTVLNSNLRILRREDFVSALHKPDGSERELRLKVSRGCWHKVSFVESGDTYWLRVATYLPLRTQLELMLG